MLLDETPLTKAFQEHLAFPPRGTKAITYYNSVIKQLKRSYSRRLTVEIAFNVFQFHYTACLQFNKSRCQNQSTPIIQRPFLNGWRSY